MKWPNFSLKKIQFEGEREFFLLTKTNEKNDVDFPDLTLELTNGSRSYRGILTSKEMKDHLRKSRLELESFVKMTIGALTSAQTEDESCNFSYTLSEEPKSVIMVWKKYIEAEDVRFQLGSATLQLVPCVDMVSAILSTATDQIMNLEKQVDSLRNEKTCLQREKEDLVATLRNKVYEKNELEEKLMSKFVLVLNAKKRKTAELKAELQSRGKKQTNGTNDECIDEPTSPGSTTASLGNPKSDSTLRLSQDDENVPTTSRRARRVRQPRKVALSTPPLSRKRSSQRLGNVSDLDTLELMEDM